MKVGILLIKQTAPRTWQTISQQCIFEHAHWLTNVTHN